MKSVAIATVALVGLGGCKSVPKYMDDQADGHFAVLRPPGKQKFLLSRC